MGGTSSPTTKKTPPVVQTNTVQPSSQLSQAEGLAANTGISFLKNPPTVPAPAPFTPAQTQGQQTMLGAASGPVSQLGTQTAGAESMLLDPNMLSAQSNPYLQSYINAALDPITENFTQSVLPNIRTGTIANSGLVGSREGIAQGLATDAYLEQLGKTTADIAYPAYEAGLNRMEGAIGQAPTVAGISMLPGEIQSAVGAQQQQQNQAVQNAALMNQFMPLLTAQDVTGFLAGLPGETTGVSSVKGVPPQPASPWQSTIGGASAGGALGSILGSIFPGIGTALGGGLGALAGGGAGYAFGG